MARMKVAGNAVTHDPFAAAFAVAGRARPLTVD